MPPTEHLADLVARASALLGDETPAAFAWLRLAQGGRERDLLLGPRTRIGDGVTVLDWQTAPLAEVFFAHDAGDGYDVEVDGRELSGTVVARAILRVERGQLVEVAPALGLGLEPSTSGERARAKSPLDVALDPAQRRVVDRPPGGALLVLGEAGCGKTTVALRRLVAIRERPEHATARCGVVVPTEGLRRFTRTLLERIGQDDVEVWLYDRWAAREAQRAFQLPQRESVNQPAAVIRVKRHPSVREVIERLAARPRRTDRRDLLSLWGDRALVEKMVARASGALRPGDVAAVTEHTRIQFGRTAAEEFKHVTDKEMLRTVDERGIDEGTPTEDAGTVDVEDYAVLFEIDRARAARHHRKPVSPRPYDCLVVDEAQELAPLELALVGRAVAPGGTLVVAGDAAQQVDPSSFFVDWAGAMRELGARAHDTVELDVTYRSPPDVTALARRLVGRALPSDAGIAETHIARRRFDNECHLVDTLVRELRQLRARDPGASVAVILRTREAATRAARLYGRGLEVRLALDGNFAFAPGIDVTSVDEVKGLEFEHVVVPDASAAAYPDTPEARRALYVAVTRTVHQLALCSVGTPSPLV